jgi:hypothetical protein
VLGIGLGRHCRIMLLTKESTFTREILIFVTLYVYHLFDRKRLLLLVLVNKKLLWLAGGSSLRMQKQLTLYVLKRLALCCRY